MVTYVVSDLRLMDHQEDFLFNTDKEKAFAALCETLEPTDALILAGHTHEMDLTESYVNLGTWIDHIASLSPDAIQKADSTLPVFVLADSGAAQLFNIRKIVSLNGLRNCPLLWSKS